MSDTIVPGNIVVDLTNNDSWGFVLKVDESAQKVVVYDQLIAYTKTIPISSVKKIHEGVVEFQTMYQQEKVNNVVNPNLSSVDSFQAPICSLDSLIPAEYEEIPSFPVSNNNLYDCNVQEISPYYVNNQDLCSLIGVYSLSSSFIPESIYRYYNSHKYTFMCQPKFHIFFHYMSPEVKSFQINNKFFTDPSFESMKNWMGNGSLYVEDLFGLQKMEDNITFKVSVESLYLSFYSIYMYESITYISFHVILRDFVITDQIQNRPILSSNMNLGHFINYLKSLDINIPDSIQCNRYDEIMMMISSIYLSSLHVPSSITQTISLTKTISYSLPQPFIFVCDAIPLRRYLQARYIYLDNEPHETQMSSFEEMAIYLDRNSEAYRFDDNLLDLIETFQSRGGEVLFQTDETDLGKGIPYKDIYIKDGDVCIPICHEGMNRSQVLYTLLQLLSCPSYPPYIYVYTSHGAISGWDLDTAPLNEENYYKSLHSDLDELSPKIIRHLNRYKNCFTESEAQDIEDEEQKSEECKRKVFYKERGGENDYNRYNENDEDTSLEGYYRAFGICKQPRYGDLIGRNIPLNVNIKEPLYDHIRYNRMLCHQYFDHIFYHQLDDSKTQEALLPFHNQSNKNHVYYFCFARSFQNIIKRLLNQEQPLDSNGNVIEQDLAHIRLVWLPIPDNITISGSEEDIEYWESLGIKNVTRALLQANSYLYTFRLYSSFIHSNMQAFIPRYHKEEDIYNDSLKTNDNFMNLLLLEQDFDMNMDINDLYNQIVDTSKLVLVKELSSAYCIYQDTTKNNQQYLCVRIDKKKYPTIDIDRYQLIYEYFVKSNGLPELPLSHIYSSLNLNHSNYDLYMFGPLSEPLSLYTLSDYLKEYPYQGHQEEYRDLVTSLVYSLYQFHTAGLIYNNLFPESILIYNHHVYLYDYSHCVVDAVNNPSSCLTLNCPVDPLRLPECFSQSLCTPYELFVLGSILFESITQVTLLSLSCNVDNSTAFLEIIQPILNEHQVDDGLRDVILILLSSDIITKQTSYELLKTNSYFNQNLLTQLP